MLKRKWHSENLIFSEFSSDEAQLSKSIFDSNLSVKAVDPTFQEWPLSEFAKLIDKSSVHKLPDEREAFYLRKISTREGDIVGYVQLEFNAPNTETLWLPMLIILPEYQRSGHGAEIVTSVIEMACSYTSVKRVGLNVYAENIQAFRFWYKQGFTQIRAFEQETEHGKEYNCLVLYRELEI